MKNNSITIAFLGPDGSGKSTIIKNITKEDNGFETQEYFHLKPIKGKPCNENQVVSDPHRLNSYSKFISYIKIFYFIFQYNLGWVRHIYKLKEKSCLVIFDRYYDDILIDYKRYRYGGKISVARFFRKFIPRPDIYFILHSSPEIIYGRKQEVSINELSRQLNDYKSLIDGSRYIGIDVHRDPEVISQEILDILKGKDGNQ